VRIVSNCIVLYVNSDKDKLNNVYAELYLHTVSYCISIDTDELIIYRRSCITANCSKVCRFSHISADILLSLVLIVKKLQTLSYCIDKDNIYNI
jgi:hypothetical protein